MTSREKTLGLAVAALAGLGVVYLIVDGMLLGPSADADKTIREIRKENAKLGRGKGRLARDKKLILGVARRVYDREPSLVEDEGTAKILLWAKMAGLRTLDPRDWKMHSNTKPGKPDVYSEVSFDISTHGRLKNIVDFLYLLSDDAHVHRVSNLKLKAVGHGEALRLDVKYTTLVLDGKLAKSCRKVRVRKQKDSDLTSRRRRRYDDIVLRNLFRPYVKPLPIMVARRTESTAPAPVNGELIVADLSQMGDAPPVGVRDTATNEMTYYDVGDKLDGGVIRLVDYRSMLTPDNPELPSQSRVILEIDSEYWAVERGQALTKRRKLKASELPKELRTSPATRPSAKGVPSAAAGG